MGASSRGTSLRETAVALGRLFYRHVVSVGRAATILFFHPPVFVSVLFLASALLLYALRR